MATIIERTLRAQQVDGPEVRRNGGMALIRARLEGITPLLFNAMSMEQLLNIRDKVKKPKNAPRPSPREEADSKVHRSRTGEAGGRVSAKKRFVLVDVGCIECGEQTDVVGIYATEGQAEKALRAHCKAVGAEQWEPRGGLLEFLGLHGKSASTYVGGTGYFNGGQRAVEVPVLPARKLPVATEKAAVAA